MTKDELAWLARECDWSKPQVLTWYRLWLLFRFMLSSPRVGKLKIQVTDFGM
jgi:hypothetical protein